MVMGVIADNIQEIDAMTADGKSISPERG